MNNIPDSLILHIFSFSHSFDFYINCKRVLKYKNDKSINLTSRNYFDNEVNSDNPKIIYFYLFLDYFLIHRHLLILDTYESFEIYFLENHWVRDLCNKNPTNTIIHESLRNIMRLSFFVNCLREIGRHQRQYTRDKLEQTNIGISFQCLIESILSQSEFQTQMLKYYMCREIPKSKC